ncbi:MAG TPA: hypothetical protein VNJ46_10735 [Gaiellaceae bacterium]|nr:hypothetical protein [Gaiellaceae bacterium]
MRERATAEPPPGPSWRRRAVLGAAALVLLLLLGWLGAAFLPRWWAHRIGDQVQGSIAAGILLGLAYGFLFTALPLALVAWAARRPRTWRVRLAYLAGAAALASPNLLTLGIAVGTGNAAHAGERTLDVEAPGFRGATLAGAILAALALSWATYLVASRRSAWRELARLRAERREREEPPAPVA